MTRIYTFGMDQETNEGGNYLVVLVAHRDSRRASRVAMTEAARHGGKWRIVHTAERRTGVRIPQGELLGATGPFPYQIVEE